MREHKHSNEGKSSEERRALAEEARGSVFEGRGLTPIPQKPPPAAAPDTPSGIDTVEKPDFNRAAGSSIVFAADLPLCECCEEPWCPVHAEHYADCPCLGPNSEEEPPRP